MSFLLNPHVFGGAAIVPVVNLIDNGTFDDTSEWVMNTLSSPNAEITGGVLLFATAAVIRNASQVSNETLVNGETLWYSFDVPMRTAGSVIVGAGRSAVNPATSGGTTLRTVSAAGSYSGVANVTVAGQYITIGVPGSSTNLSVDNLVVKKALQNLTPTSASIAEDASIGTNVVAITRGRSGSTFSLAANPGDKFAIDPSTGQITVAAGLDYETATSHVLTVRETNAAYPNSPRDTNVTINVTNVFDGTPGAELNPDPGFDTAGLWTLTGGAVVTGSFVEIPANGTAAISFAGDFEQGATYRFTFTIDATNFAQIMIAGSQAVVLGSGAFVNPGTYTAEFKMTAAPGSPANQLRIEAFISICRLSALSVKKVSFP